MFQSRRSKKYAGIGLGVLMGCLVIPRFQASNAHDRPAPPLTASMPLPPPPSSPAVPGTSASVWLVDKTHEFETYSNGLRIDNRYAVSNERRLFYPVYHRDEIDASQPEWRSEPAGIIYHTTESDQVRFDPDQNRELKRIGQEVLTFVKRHRSYHFFDRPVRTSLSRGPGIGCAPITPAIRYGPTTA